MKISSIALRGATALVIGGVLACGATAIASAADDGSDVDVNVDIVPIEEPGVLALTVAADSTSLVESGSTATVRQFTGTLPTVTVTDTRRPEDIPAGAGWSVLGSATAFTGAAGQAPIPAGNLGWAPQLVAGDQEGLVSAGLDVQTVLDTPTQPGNNVGLVDQELLFATFDSGAIVTEGQWSANAQLFLRTPATVAAGSYTSKLTLSLFE
jgi:hypothetical protein